MSDLLYRLIHDSTRVISLAPAVGRTYPPKGQTVFDGTEAACEAQITALGLAPLPDQALTAAKTAKLAALAKTLAQPVTVEAITMATDADTQTQLNHLVTLLQLAYSQQPDADQTAFLALNISTITGTIVDTAGVGHDMTVTQALQFVLQYGQAYGAARAAYQTQVAAVNAATTVAAVNAIT